MISIIIPIYNSENYLGKAITSILNQTFTSFELILVNDGSPDNSESICLKYAKSDKRIKYVKQKNQGAAHAMQTGLKLASLDYVMFLDGDDWIELDTLFKIQGTIKEYKTDIVFWNHFKEFEDSSIETRKAFINSHFYIDEELNWLKRRAFGLVGEELSDIRDFDLISSGWGKIYKRKLLTADPYILISEENIGKFDTELVCRAFLFASSIYYLDEPLNHYRMENNNSVTKNHGNELYLKHKVMFTSLLDFARKNNLDSNYVQAIHNRISVSILNNLLSLTSKNNKNSLATKYRALKSILNDGLYIEAINNFEFNSLNPSQRCFFYLCKFRIHFLVFSTGYLLKLIR
jgi:glycosyltransferase EpsH